jgi:hypothetical protein
MWRLSVLVLIAATAQAQPARSTCLFALTPAIESELGTAMIARDAAFAKALATRKFKRWTGAVHVRERKQGERDSANLIDAGMGEYGQPPQLEFVSDKRGIIYQVQRVARGERKNYWLCGCPPLTRGGAAVQYVQYVAELPAKTTYGGQVRVEYVDEMPTVGYAGANCPQPP